MQAPVVTPESLRAARENAQLSQSAVSRATGLSRTDVSRFENGWLVLPDEKAEAVASFITEHLPADFQAPAKATQSHVGAHTEAPDQAVASAAPSGVWMLDGIQVAPAVPDVDAERMADELGEALGELDGLLPQARDVGFFASTEGVDRAFRLLATCGLLLRKLHGRSESTDSDSEDTRTIEAYLVRKLLSTSAANESSSRTGYVSRRRSGRIEA